MSKMIHMNETITKHEATHPCLYALLCHYYQSTYYDMISLLHIYVFQSKLTEALHRHNSQSRADVGTAVSDDGKLSTLMQNSLVDGTPPLPLRPVMYNVYCIMYGSLIRQPVR